MGGEKEVSSVSALSLSLSLGVQLGWGSHLGWGGDEGREVLVCRGAETSGEPTLVEGKGRKGDERVSDASRLSSPWPQLSSHPTAQTWAPSTDPVHQRL